MAREFNTFFKFRKLFYRFVEYKTNVVYIFLQLFKGERKK